MAHSVGVSSYKLKGCGFDPCSGHTLKLQVQSLVGAHSEGNPLIYLSHINVSLPLSLSLKSINISLAKDLKKKKCSMVN